MEAVVQARTKLSSWGTAGSAQGLKKISWSVLKEVTIIHRNGKTTRMVQMTRKNCETPSTAREPMPPRRRRSTAGRGRASVAASRDWMVMVSSGLSLELDGLALGQAERQHRQHQREEQKRDPHGGGVAELRVLEGRAVHVARDDLG